MNSSKTLELLRKLGISPKRSLGQNFLIGESPQQKILRAVEKQNPEALVEVGPGLGALTEKLCQWEQPLTLLELDKTFARYHRETQAENSNVTVVEGDAMDWTWSDTQATDTCLVSNLPYQISSRLVVDRSLFPFGITSMVLMFQKEVAQRILSEPKKKSYGLLTVIAQSFWTISTVCDAGPSAFYPRPNVASRVLAFRRRQKKEIAEPVKYLAFLKAGFAQRRKYLLSNLISGMVSPSLNREALEAILTGLGHSQQARAEELSVSEWIQFYQAVKDSGLGN